MANIDTYIFANGKLKLAIHGPRRGGNVLMLDDGTSTKQCQIGDNDVKTVIRHLSMFSGGQFLGANNVTEERFYDALAADFSLIEEAA